ncbi:MAG: EI24 domain-containing protein [Crocinitomicaceae bacterium]|nr:EI24 domain-containing protein [Crocinitomicaceae bacterium]
MNFLRQLGLGFRNYGKAIGYIRTHKLYWYFPIPALLMLVIYFIGSEVSHWQASWDNQKGCLECVTMNDTIWFLIKLLVSIFLGLTLMKFSKYIVVILLSPLFSILSEKVEKDLTGNKYPFNLRQTIHDVKRGVRIALRNIIWTYVFISIILLVTFFGWENPRASPFFYLSYFIVFFYYGFSFIDYINERRRLDIVQSIHFMRNHRGLAIAIGSVYSLLILVPVDIGVMLDYSNFLEAPFETLGASLSQVLLWFLASVSPILAIVAATLSMHELVDLSSNKWSQKAHKNEDVVSYRYRDDE